MNEHANTYIDVTLCYGDQEEDMHVPLNREVRDMIRELDVYYKRTTPRQKYQIKVLTKGFLIDEGKCLSDYPVTSGDILEIKE